jgi:hypothetical protein
MFYTGRLFLGAWLWCAAVCRAPLQGTARFCSGLLIPFVSCSFKFRAPPVVPLNGSPVLAPKVYQLSELGNRVNSVDSEERNNDSGRGRSHVVYMPGSMVGTDQYIMRNPNIRIRTVLVRCGGVPVVSVDR